MPSLPASPPWLSSDLLLPGPLWAPTLPPPNYPGLLGFLATPLRSHSEWGSHVKISPAFFELVIYYFYQMVQAKHGRKKGKSYSSVCQAQ